ncbi:MAG: DUF4386 domain-containing protein [Chloroflexota bacterium]
MHAHRRSALAAGILFIAATVLGLAGSAVMRPLLGEPLDFARIASDPTAIFAGFLLKLVGYAACPAIALAMYPVLRAHGQAAALGSVVFRTLETVFYMAAASGALVVVFLARATTDGTTADQDFARAAGSLLLATMDWIGFGVAVPFFALGALLYYVPMYRASLVPRWLSGWGILAAILALAASALVLVQAIAPMSPLHLVLNFAIFIQEMVLAVWLMARGFAVEPAAEAPRLGEPILAGSAS